MTDNEPTPRCALASCRAPFLPSQPVRACLREQVPGDLDDEHGIYAGDPGHACGYDPDSAWHERMAYSEAVEAIQARYDRLLEPFRAALRRNPGVRPVAMGRLEQQRDAEIQKLVRTHERARALDNAVRQAPQRAVQAAERQQEQAALNAFGRDLMGGSRRYQAPVWTGRPTDDIASW